MYNNGNRLNCFKYNFTLKPISELQTLSTTNKDCFIYNKDQLIKFNGTTFTYDSIGNPTSYKGLTLEWGMNRELTKFNNVTFSYDAFGRRTSKNTINYYYSSNGNLLAQSNGLKFLYDNTGIMGFVNNSITYFYRKDCQGNIIAILDNTGNVLAEYVYDAWGNHAILDANGNDISDSSTNIANLNPFRYRGYYYDTETGLYYLKSRYYDPEIGRFITIDDISYLDPETINGLNLYAYCGNNPIMNVDPNGNAWWHWVLGAVAVVALGAIVVASAIVTGGASLVAMGVGFAVGATASVASQGITNVINGNGFFDNINIGTVLIGGLAGAAFAGAAFVPALGSLAGAFGIGFAANVATSSVEQKSIGEILFNGLVGGLAAGLAFEFGQYLGNVVYGSNDFTFKTFFDASRIDGANLFRATLTSFNSSWYKFIPSLAPGITRAIINMIWKKRR